MKMSSWLEPELQRGLRNVAAPADLWDRVRSAPAPLTQPIPRPRMLVWAMAATVTMMTVGLSVVQRRAAIVAADPQRYGVRCENPAELRAYVRANAGLEAVARTAPAQVRLRGPMDVQTNSLTCSLCHLD